MAQGFSRLPAITTASAAEMFPVSARTAILGVFREHCMNDLQAKFAITLVALGFFFAYAFPAVKGMNHNHDAVIQEVGQAYAAPDQSSTNPPSGDTSIEPQR